MNAARILALLGVALSFLVGPILYQSTGNAFLAALLGCLPATLLVYAAVHSRLFQGARPGPIHAGYLVALILVSTIPPPAAALVDDATGDVPHALLASWPSWPPTKADLLRIGGTAAIVGVGCAFAVVTAGVSCAASLGAAGSVLAGTAVVNTAWDVGTNMATGRVQDAYLFQTWDAIRGGDPLRALETSAGLIAPGTANLADRIESGQNVGAFEVLGVLGDVAAAKPLGAAKAVKAMSVPKATGTMADLFAPAARSGGNVAKAIDVAKPVAVAAEKPGLLGRLFTKAPAAGQPAKVVKPSSKALAVTRAAPKVAAKYTAKGQVLAEAKWGKAVSNVGKSERVAKFAAKPGGAKMLSVGGRMARRPLIAAKGFTYYGMNASDNAPARIRADDVPHVPPNLDECRRYAEDRGWDASLLCRRDVLDFLQCLTDAATEEDKAACAGLLTSTTLEEICEATQYAFCANDVCPTTPEACMPEPPDVRQQCLQLTTQEACDWIAARADPETQFLNLLVENHKPVVSLDAPKAYHRSGEGSVYEVGVTVDRGVGLSCQDDFVRALARFFHYCLEAYQIHAIEIVQDVDGTDLLRHPYSRAELVAAGVLNEEDETARLVLPWLLDYGRGPTRLGASVRVYFTLVPVGEDGAAVGEPQLYEGGAERSWEVTPCESEEACEGGAPPGGSDEEPRPGDPDAPACNDPECWKDRVDDSLGGVGLKHVDWKVLVLVAAGLVLAGGGFWYWKSGRLYLRTGGKFGRKPQAEFTPYRPTGWLDKFKRALTGKAPPSKLKDAYLAGEEVPVTAPANPEGTGPDLAELDRRLTRSKRPPWRQI